MTQRSSVEIAAELAEFRAARATLVKGEMVESVNNDGGGMRMKTPSLDQVENAITLLEREYKQAVQVESGASKRRFITAGF